MACCLAEQREGRWLLQVVTDGLELGGLDTAILAEERLLGSTLGHPGGIHRPCPIPLLIGGVDVPEDAPLLGDRVPSRS
jgi:hypothetical protein